MAALSWIRQPTLSRIAGLGTESDSALPRLGWPASQARLRRMEMPASENLPGGRQWNARKGHGIWGPLVSALDWQGNWTIVFGASQGRFRATLTRASPLMLSDTAREPTPGDEEICG